METGVAKGFDVAGWLISCVLFLLGSIGVLSAAPASALAAVEPPSCVKAIWGQGDYQPASWTRFLEGSWKSACRSKPEITYLQRLLNNGLLCWGDVDGLEKEPGVEPSECAAGGKGSLDTFVGTDLAPTKPEMTIMDIAGGSNPEGKGFVDNGMVSVPVAQAAIAVIVTMPVGCVPTIPEGASAGVDDSNLEEQWWAGEKTLAQQVLLRKGSWSGSACTSSSPPTLVAMSRPSGATAAFKDFLDAVNSRWQSFIEPEEIFHEPLSKTVASSWPQNFRIHLTAESPAIEASNVYETPNSMGYVDLAAARNAGFPGFDMVRHKTSQGEVYSFMLLVQSNAKELHPNEFAEPEKESGEADCGGKLYTGTPKNVAPNSDWSGVRLEAPLDGEDGKWGYYPICTLTFDLAWQHYGLVGSYYGSQEMAWETANTVRGYLGYVVSEAGQKGLAAEHYAPLPGGPSPAPFGIARLAQEGITEANIGK
jgi:ABC-type phosphate transport system substrate-binding protein